MSIMLNRYALIIVLLGALVRLTVWYANPPNNAYDDHLEVIAHVARSFERPTLDNCFQCYHPPLYYFVQAMVLRGTHAITGSFWIAWRTVQLSSVLFSILHLLVCWKILSSVTKPHLPSQLCALAVLTFLPRDIYTSAFIANDTAVILLGAIAILIYTRGFASEVSHRPLIALVIPIILAAWTKQHGLILWLLPTTIMVTLYQSPSASSVTRDVKMCCVFIYLVGTIIVFGEEAYKTAKTGFVMVSNQHFFDWVSSQPPGRLSLVTFTDFRFRELFRSPFMSPATLGSFWTEVFARFWFDYEPKFLADSYTTRAIGRISYCVGLAITLAWGIGFLRALWEWRANPRKLCLLIVLCLFVLVPAAQTLRFPYFSSMKAMFILPSLSISALILAHSFRWMWEGLILRTILLSVVVSLALSTISQACVMVEGSYSAVNRALWPFPPLW